MLNADVDEVRVCVCVYIYIYIYIYIYMSTDVFFFFKRNDRVHHGPLVEAEEALFIQLQS